MRKFASLHFLPSRRTILCIHASNPYCLSNCSQWPTIPQLYVNGEFIGGCDIVTQMHESGELKELLKEAKED